MRDILNSPIPRVYEEGENGVAVPADSERPIIGQDVQVRHCVGAAASIWWRLCNSTVDFRARPTLQNLRMYARTFCVGIRPSHQ